MMNQKAIVNPRERYWHLDGNGSPDMHSKVIRLVAARRLQQFGWALVHYAQGIERAILKQESFREEVAHAWHSKAIARLLSFLTARRAFHQSKQ